MVAPPSGAHTESNGSEHSAASPRNLFTDIPHLYSLLKVKDEEEQVCYYQPGIGTNIETKTAYSRLTKMKRKGRQLLDLAFAASLEKHICDGYRFLMTNYRQATASSSLSLPLHFTARTLAGMLESVGLLLPGNQETIPTAYSLYADWSLANKEVSRCKSGDGTVEKETLREAFKRTYSREVKVHFVGVWDTVSAVGGVGPTFLPFVSESTRESRSFIKTFRQALALDERRGHYAEQVWVGRVGSEEGATDVKQVWFPGSHSDVGGGAFL
ncbi:hypothetical protein JCM10213_001720 [Rhodosporidiobolus nylandii]